MLEILGDCVYRALGLRESLQDERAALETQDTEALHAALTIKGVCVSKLQELDTERKTICEASGFGANPDQMQEMLAWCDEDNAIAGCWQHLMEIVADCNALNLTNGAIIRLRRQMVDGNLAVLRGTEAIPDTYKREGRDNAANTQRSLAQA